MKKVNLSLAFKSFLLFLFGSLQVMIAAAQDNTNTNSTHTTTVTKETTTSTDWYMQPWVWIVGGAVLLIILVALLRGNSNKEVTRTTIVRDDR
ncbi:MAG: hypothetical protein ABI688_10490 [Bacteroidota bacterium]